MSLDRKNLRYFEIAGISIKVESDLPFTPSTFGAKFESFETDSPGDDLVTIRHHFDLPDLDAFDLGEEVYRKLPWAISKRGGKWYYRGISPISGDQSLHRFAVMNSGHTSTDIYSPDSSAFIRGNLHSLTLFPTDQILLSRVLADRQGCYFHSSGVVLGNRGLLFVGHSDAGKSTTLRLLKDHGEPLCDDRNIVRRWPDGFRVHGTWSHGEVPIVSSASAPLHAIVFLKRSSNNRIVPLPNRREIIRRLLGCVIRPLTTADWWEKTFDLMEAIPSGVPCYEMEFDKSGAIVPLIEDLAAAPAEVPLTP